MWVTSVPFFLGFSTGAPCLELLLAHPRLKGALAAISAAVVGVILNLSVWFALHVLFARVTPATFGPLPDWSSFDAVAAGLIALAAVLMLGLRLGMIPALALMALAGGLARSLS